MKWFLAATVCLLVLGCARPPPSVEELAAINCLRDAVAKINGVSNVRIAFNVGEPLVRFDLVHSDGHVSFEYLELFRENDHPELPLVYGDSLIYPDAVEVERVIAVACPNLKKFSIVE